MDEGNKNNLEKINWGWVVATIVFAWSVYTYNQLLPLSQANVIFLESSNIMHSNSDDVIQSGNAMTSFDVIEPLVKNIGKAIAEDIKFKIYAVYFDDSLKFPSSNDSVEKYFNTQIVHDLPPETTANFGIINLPHITENCERNLIKERQQVALVFHLRFTDSLFYLFPKNKIKDRFFFFQYNIGGDRFYSLIDSDYQKIHDRLKTKLEKEDKDEMDKKLLEFIKNTE